jgi:hypothetical protein
MMTLLWSLPDAIAEEVASPISRRTKAERGKISIVLPAFLSLPPRTPQSAKPQTLQSQRGCQWRSPCPPTQETTKNEAYGLTVW